MSLKCLYSYICTAMYKFSKYTFPELFENFISNDTTIHGHDTRSARLNHMYIQFKGTSPIWNIILSHLETDCAIGTFKTLCTAFYSLIRKETCQTEFHLTWIFSMFDCLHFLKIAVTCEAYTLCFLVFISLNPHYRRYMYPEKQDNNFHITRLCLSVDSIMYWRLYK